MGHPSFSFGPFRVDRSAYRLFKNDEPVDLSPKAIDLLLLLAGRAGTLVTKDEILGAVWPDVAVTDNALTQVVSDLRHALGDNASAPKYLETVPRRGYRFIAQVQSAPLPDSQASKLPGSPGRSIAVLDFRNVSGDRDLDWLARGIAETLTNDLRAIRELRVLDRALLSQLDPEGAADALASAGLDLVVIGGIQRSGDRLRVTARLTDVRTRQALAHAKADGLLTDVFGLQDAIILQLAAGLQIPVNATGDTRLRAGETSNLDAYRALTEGRVKLESLDPADIPAAIADFERALELDPAYALAHVGLAHARFWRYQATRARNRPDIEELRAAIHHASRAIELDQDLAEAHSALGFFLASADRQAAAVAAARRAVSLEPGNWRHLFRLGVAAWGEERQACLQSVISQYPLFAYAYYALAMLAVARRDFDRACSLLGAGIESQKPSPGAHPRFPASGLHWLTGLVRLAKGDVAGARSAFDRELDSKGSRLFAEEFARDTHDGQGFALLESGDAAGAAKMFEAALARYPDHARTLIGLAETCRRLGAADRAAELMAHARRAIDELRANDRAMEAALATAAWQLASGRPGDAVVSLRQYLMRAEPGSAGWMIPVDPALAPLRRHAGFDDVLARLAERAN